MKKVDVVNSLKEKVDLLLNPVLSHTVEKRSYSQLTEDQQIVYDNSDKPNQQAMLGDRWTYFISVNKQQFASNSNLLILFNQWFCHITLKEIAKLSKIEQLDLKLYLSDKSKLLIPRDISSSDQYGSSFAFAGTAYIGYTYTDYSRECMFLSNYFSRLKEQIERAHKICQDCLKNQIFSKVDIKKEGYRYGKTSIMPADLLSKLKKTKLIELFPDGNLVKFRNLLLNEHNSETIFFHLNQVDIFSLIKGLHANDNWNPKKSRVNWSYWGCIKYKSGEDWVDVAGKNKTAFKKDDHKMFTLGKDL